MIIMMLVLCKRKQTNGFIRNVKYVKLNEPDSLHAVMTTKPTNSWDYKKLEENCEDNKLAINNDDNDDDDYKKNSD